MLTVSKDTVQKNKRCWLLVLLLVLLAAFGLRTHRLENKSIWWDEGFSVWMSRMPVSEMVIATSTDTHPPLSYALTHWWMGVAGDEEFALRLLSVFAGVLTVALTYQIGRELGGRRAGLAGMLLITLAQLPLSWSQEIRMHALAPFFMALAFWLAIRIFAERPGMGWLAAAAAVVTGLGLLNVYLYAVVPLALNLAFVVAFFYAQRRWRMLLFWGASQAGALAIFLPWFLFASSTVPFAGSQPPVGVWHLVLLFLSSLFTGFSSNLNQLAPLLAVCALVILLAAAVTGLVADHRRRGGWAALIFGTILPPLVIYLLFALPRAQNHTTPTPVPRYFVLLAGATYALIGWGAVELNKCRRHTGTVIIAALLGLFIWSLRGYYAGRHLVDDYISAVAVIEAQRRPDELVMLNNDLDWPIFSYHYAGTDEIRVTNTQVLQEEQSVNDMYDHLREGIEGVWLVQTTSAQVSDPAGHVATWWNYRSGNRVYYDLGDLRLWFFDTGNRSDTALYGLSSQWPRGFEAASVHIAAGVDLAGHFQPVPEIYSGDILTIGLGWHADSQAVGEWPVALKLVAPDGTELLSELVTITAPGQAGNYYLPFSIFIPADTPAVTADLVFVAGENWQALGKIRILERRDQVQNTVIPENATTLNIRYGENIVLAAVNFPDDMADLSPGDAVPLTLYWQADTPIPEHYKVFVHLVSADDGTSTIWGQQDQEPGGGATPTTGWLPGRIIPDDYLIYIDQTAPPGTYRLQVGLYRPLENTRLPVSDAEVEQYDNAAVIYRLKLDQ